MVAALVLVLAVQVAAPPYRVGVGVADITPEPPIRLSGYAARPVEVTAIGQRLHAKALAVAEADGPPIVLLAVDATAMTLRLRDAVLARVPGLAGDRLALTVTHTHAAPMLTGIIPNMFGAAVPAEEQARIDAHTGRAVDGMAAAVRAALADLRPAWLEHGAGRATFARNRRTDGGPVDWRVPVLRVRDADGRTRAIVFAYACHCTALGGDHLAVSGDWAGFAQDAVEAAHPGAVALCAIGAGADANPHPRGALAHAEQHGREIAAAVETVLARPLQPVRGALAARFSLVELPFAPRPERAQLAERASRGGADGYAARVQLARLDRGEALPAALPYPVQVFAFGDELALAFLGGELVVDYALALRAEFDRERLWVVGYANEVAAYIPSERILREGGYEGGGAMIYYDQPAAFAPGVETVVTGAVRALLPAAYRPYAGVDPARTEGIPPRAPARAKASLRAPEGLRVDLVAGEPMVEDPVAIDFAADGSVFVAEMRDYPSAGEGVRGRVTRLVDRDRDGRFEHAERFLEDVTLPTGVLAWRDGVFVCAATEVLFAADRDGDGHAEVREVVMRGFAAGNEQALPNSLALGLDGQVHGAIGLIGGVVTSPRTGVAVDLRGRDFRFDPRRGGLEALLGRTQQGRARDDFDAWFGCDSMSLAFHLPLRAADQARNPHHVPGSIAVRVPAEADADVMHALSEQVARYNDLHLAGRTTSACGVTIYRDGWLGHEYAGDLFVCEPVANAVIRLELARTGATFAGRRASTERAGEFLASTDPWFRPVQVRTGPDGALWVVDMCRYLIEHPRWLPADRLAAIDRRAGEGLGRIWRLLPARGARPIADLARAPRRASIEALASANGTVRDLAHGLLLHEPTDADLPGLRALLAPERPAPVRAHAASLLADRDALGGAEIVALLAAPEPALRAHAVRLARGWLGRHVELTQAVLALAGDADVGVSVEVAAALGDLPGPRSGQALAALLLASEPGSILRDAVLGAALPHLGALLDAVASVPPARQAELLGALAPSIAGAGDEVLRARLGRLLAAGSLPRAVAFELAARLPGLAHPPALTGQARAALADAGAPGDERRAAAELLGLAGGAEAPGLLRAFEGAGPELRDAIFAALVRTPEGAAALLDAAALRPALRGALSPARQQVLRRHGDARVRARAERELGEVASRRTDVIARYAAVDARRGDFVRGEQVFARTCAACHALGGAGRDVGPDLAAITDRSTSGLLTAILDPNRGVLDSWAMYVVTLRDGGNLAGRIAAETGHHVTLVGVDGARRDIARADIATMQGTGTSLMPEGLEAQLDLAQMADLFAFLRAERRARKVVDGNVPATCVPAADGSLTLPAAACEIYGGELTLEPAFGNLGYWHATDDVATWTLELPAAGAFRVELDYACADAAAGNAFALEGGAAPVTGSVAGTGGWDRYRTLAAGAVELPAGRVRLTLRPAAPVRGALMDLRAIRLLPR